MSTKSEGIDLCTLFERDHLAFEYLCAMLLEYDKPHVKGRRMGTSKSEQPPSTVQVESSYLCFIMAVNKTFRNMVTTLNVYFLQACGVHAHPLFASNYLKHVKTIIFSRSVLNKTMDYLDFSAMSRRWVNLKELQLDYCHDVGAALRAFARSSPNLERLSLRYCEGMNRYTKVILSFKSLSYLIVDGSDITFETSQRLLSGVAHLNISMRYCENLGKKDSFKRKKKAGSGRTKNKHAGFIHNAVACGLEKAEMMSNCHSMPSC